ncbi:SGNH hydrolase [Lenzites betulinus]|nr:SGNH hydrolase [Lenzites betulinus]
MTANVQDTIVLLGDSLTEMGAAPEGYATKLGEVYIRKLDVVNRGFSGYNTDWIIPVFEQIWPKQQEAQQHPKTRLLVVWLGANDAARAHSKHHVPLERYEANLAELVRRVRSPESAFYSPDTRLVFINPPPVQPERWVPALAEYMQVPEAPPDRDLEQSRLYAEAMNRVGEREGVPVVDAWGKIWAAAGGTAGGLTPFLSDGLHLTGEGYKIVFDALIATIAEKYPELHYERLPLTFPLWNEIFDGMEQQRSLSEITKKRT